MTKEKSNIVYDDSKTWTIYMHTNLINGKRYVGITSKKPPEKRWRKDGSGYKKQSLFWNAIQKYGWENFKHEIILRDEPLDFAKKVERCLIKHYKTRNKKYGYNLTDGGEGMNGWVPPEEWRRKQSENKKGHHITEEQKIKISEANKGRKLSKEAKEKISKASKERWANPENHPMYGKHPSEETKRKRKETITGKYTGENSFNYGRHHSEETKEKLRKARIGTTLSEETKQKIKQWQKEHPQERAKKVRCIETGVVFNSINEAQREMKLWSVGDCCRGEKESTHGYHFEFVNKEDINNETG